MPAAAVPLVAAVRLLRSLAGLGSLSDSGAQLTEPVDMFVECIEYGLELHLRQLGEDLDVLDAADLLILNSASTCHGRGTT
jgi:hypothetical protein